MQFQDSDIKKLAELSRLELTSQEVEKFRGQLTSILEYVEQISAITLEDPDFVGTEGPKTRKDEPAPGDATADELMQSAPHTEEGHISVSRVQQ